MKTVFKIYFAGELFNHKDLTGNALLSSYIEQKSKGQYEIILPQNLKTAKDRAVEIRDQNLKRIIECDLGIFNFDGADLDSGTVVEFVFAKFLDIPSVIIRSDFRKAGDQSINGGDWNLMCSFFPRTKLVRFNAMELYQDALEKSSSLSEAIEQFYSKISSQLINSLNSARNIKPLLKNDKGRLELLYQWALRFPGGDLETLCSEYSFIQKILGAKLEKGLF